MTEGYHSQYDPLNIPITVLPEIKIPIRDPSINLACAYNEHNQIHLISKPVPTPSAHQVLLHIRATGLCGSDVHFWKHGRVGSKMVVEHECGAGHESAGEVVAVGEGVTKVKVGDRVAVEAGVPCGACGECRRGKYQACPKIVFFSTPPYHGTLSRYHLHPEDWVHKIPDEISFEEGALLEPFVVALAGIERVGMGLGDSVLIAGAGPIGLLTLLSSFAAGATPIILTDLSPSRLAFAKTLVPTVRTVLVKIGEGEEELGLRIREAAGLEGGVEKAIECTGVEGSLRGCVFAMKFGGVIHVIGVGKDYQTLPFMHMSSNEIDLRFQFRYANLYPKAIRIIQSGLINLKPLVTHRFSLENSVEAFHTAADITKGSIKCQVLDDAF